jgi:hypothetical protein
MHSAVPYVHAYIHTYIHTYIHKSYEYKHMPREMNACMRTVCTCTHTHIHRMNTNICPREMHLVFCVHTYLRTYIHTSYEYKYMPREMNACMHAFQPYRMYIHTYIHTSYEYKYMPRECMHSAVPYVHTYIHIDIHTYIV